ncbi:nucleoside triphosphate pyrophosphohydrolase [Phenylobacterium sp.]|jgi:predicted house-cleaning noncanonical NTP pyrophosphatase (MazG superfamily)|uniref:nucleoside triphosphate pyrophosphohydrolase n=1 Tax=Phenylobacterium sp. TaxID=1871053 RepID=UPI002E302BAA|nr:nucleoside triphosphate pyrophosphohydrolase [Phenylobacterium sp.]HEX4710121.1 nucleoside triphosphate pyrophosphohydrolase [Phenylobacterium sp.]
MRLRFKVDKLIRDKLPAMMQAQGLSVFTRRLDDAEFVGRLKDKLVEEAVEARAAGARADLIDELADLREVVLALAEASEIAEHEIEARRLAKRAERGGFDDRVHNAAVEGEEAGPGVAYYLARPAQYPQEER